MPFGVVLLPDRATHDRLAALAAAAAGTDPINALGDHAPAHVTVAHFDADAAQADLIRARADTHTVRSLAVKIIGLLYGPVPPGDYYVPSGGVYYGLEIVRRPDLNALHEQALGWVAEAGATPIGLVGADYRPHVTLGVSGRPALPDLTTLPAGELTMTLGYGELGPYGTFPGLRPW